MFDFLKTFFDLLFDNSRSIWDRFKKLILIIVLVLFIDNFFSLSFNFYISNKLNNLETINNLKVVYKNNKCEYNELVKVEKKILNRHHYSEIFSNLLVKWSDNNQSNKQLKNEKVSKKIIKEIYSNPYKNTIRYKIIMILSSNLNFILFLIVFIFLPFSSEYIKNKKFFINWILGIFVFLLWIIITTFLLSLIPVIFKNITYNYILNGIFQLTTSFIIIYFIEKEEKKKSKS